MKHNTISATALIKEDHRAVKNLYREYKAAAGDTEERDRLAEQICSSLDMHAKMEEKHFYPAMQKQSKTKGDLKVAEAYAEHLGMKALVKTVKAMPEGRVREATLKTLMSVVQHHVKEEEREMLPQAEKLLGVEELNALGSKMASMSPSKKQERAQTRYAM